MIEDARSPPSPKRGKSEELIGVMNQVLMLYIHAMDALRLRRRRKMSKEHLRGEEV